MQFGTRKEQRGTVLSIAGRMDAITSPELEKGVSTLVDGGEKRLVIDLKNVEYISSSGLRILLALGKRLKVEQGKLAFANLQGPPADVFKISGFYTLFTICDSVEAALEQVGKAE